MAGVVARGDKMRLRWELVPGGVHAWYLSGPAGVVQLLAMESAPRDGRWLGLDLGFHSPTPIPGRDELVSADCPALGGRCFYSGSSWIAAMVLEGLGGSPTAPKAWWRIFGLLALTYRVWSEGV